MFAIPLAWLQLTYQKGRLAIAILGIMFAVILIAMQLGFQESLFKSAVLLHLNLRSDLILIHPSSNNLLNLRQFPRRRLFQALGFTGVKSVHPAYIGLAVWNAPKLGIKEDILAIGVSPQANPFLFPNIQPDLDKTQLPDVFLFDRGSREDFYGSIATEYESAIAQGKTLTQELSNRNITIGGLFTMGVSFAANGTVITSEQNFLRIFPDRLVSNISLGLVQLEKGVNVIAIRDTLRSHLDQDVKVLTRQEFIDLELNYWSAATPIGFIFGLGVGMGFIVGVVIVYQVLYKDVSDHLAEYATLKAMGYSNIFLFRLVLQESFLLSLCGFIPAMAICAILYSLTQNATGLLMELNSDRLLQLFLLTISMCIISGTLSLRKVQTADPAEIFD
ncbi:FtsX-like permease family protein [Pseudanabaena sp. FACHB-1998]|uniref:ABC transporter permease DevC n=1 Tax=Pseudanabaena sp. FACHB-1998 TaxID=2692858 RepID=UPI0016800593|nr:ABC transporter permease DevC [Pseudanabaena sp. FACHB-1998]MBD2178070.1 FtsX-like permease family protein [Pseudanabaena sp. FACHB-1998]